MDIKQQLVLAILDKTVKSKVANVFQSNFNHNGFKDRFPLELYDISFRLYKPTANFVNLEFLVSSPIGRFFQPIGLFDKDLNVYLLNEHVEAFTTLRNLGKTTENIKFIDKKLNAVIAAFSMSTIEHVLQVFKEFKSTGWEQKVVGGVMLNPGMQYDKRYECNGFDCELLFSHSGYPQFYLDDEHEIEGAIGAYILDTDGSLSIHPTVDFKELFDKANRLKLLTAFNKI